MKKSKGDIVIGASWNFKEGMLLEGINIAIDEVNKNGGIKGKKLILEARDDKNSVNQGLMNASYFANNPQVLAVIGPTTSDIAVPASSIYEYNGLLMLNPAATAMELVANKYKYIFRTIPNNIAQARGLVKYFASKGYKKVMICYYNSYYGLSMANEFENTAIDISDINVVDRISYDIGDFREFESILNSWENYNFDSILFAGLSQHDADFVTKVRDSKLRKIPLIFTDIDESILKAGKEKVEGAVAPVFFHPKQPSSKYATFRDKFVRRYGTEPDTWAVIGYDSLKVLIEAASRSKTLIPLDIAAQLEKIRNFEGIANRYGFSDVGDLLTDETKMQIIKNGKFEYLG